MSAIPEQWIQRYVDTWIETAQKLGPTTVLGKAALDRADHAMDLVEAWRAIQRAQGRG